MAENSQSTPNRRPIQRISPRQQRCYICQDSNHIASQCKSRNQPEALLAGLPVEILELICSFVVEKPANLFAWRLWGLRLTCKALNFKTLNYYTEAAYKTLLIHLDYWGLQRLVEISQIPYFATKVDRIYVLTYNKTIDDNDEYAQTLLDSTSEEIAPGERSAADLLLRRAYREQDDKSFIEQSATDGIMLTLAFQRMPNIRHVCFQNVELHRPSIRRSISGVGESSTRVFSVLVASLANAGLKPQILEGAFREYFLREEGVSLQALAMPSPILNSLSELRTLELLLATSSHIFRNPKAWQNQLGRFLCHCPQLRSLSLGFQKDWNETERVFANVALTTILPVLETLSLSYIRCAGTDFKKFLGAHNKLQSISLFNIDIVGHTTFSEILSFLHETHRHLTNFKSSQISQDSRRLFFESLAKLDESTSHISRDLGVDEQLFFDNDYVFINGPFKYHCVAEEWEGVQSKIGLLAQDLRVSTRQGNLDPDEIWTFD